MTSVAPLAPKDVAPKFTPNFSVAPGAMLVFRVKAGVLNMAAAGPVMVTPPAGMVSAVLPVFLIVTLRDGLTPPPTTSLKHQLRQIDCRAGGEKLAAFERFRSGRETLCAA